MIKCIKE